MRSKKSTLEVSFPVMDGIYVNFAGEPGTETESPKSPTSQKKAKPTRACDWCRKKKVRSPESSLFWR